MVVGSGILLDLEVNAIRLVETSWDSDRIRCCWHIRWPHHEVRCYQVRTGKVDAALDQIQVQLQERKSWDHNHAAAVAVVVVVSDEVMNRMGVVAVVGIQVPVVFDHPRKSMNSEKKEKRRWVVVKRASLRKRPCRAIGRYCCCYRGNRLRLVALVGTDGLLLLLRLFLLLEGMMRRSTGADALVRMDVGSPCPEDPSRFHRAEICCPRVVEICLSVGPMVER